MSDLNGRLKKIFVEQGDKHLEDASFDEVANQLKRLFEELCLEVIGPDLDYRGNSPEVMVNETKAAQRERLRRLL